MSRLRARLGRGDAGFTLMEVLVAMTIGLIITTAALTLMDITMRRTRETGQRIDADQRGRMLMDSLTRVLRSQICQSSDVPPIRETTRGVVGGHWTESVSFYTDMTDGRADGIPDLRTLTFDETTRTVTEAVYTGTNPGTGITYSATPNPGYPRVIGTGIVRNGSTDVFQYFAFDDPPDGSTPTPTKALPSPMGVGAANTKVVARVVLNFRVLPEGLTTQTRTSAAYQDEIFVREADPNDPAPIPTCV